MGQVDAILEKLTLAEKVKLVSGASAWRTHEIPGAGVPVLKVSDGPNGIRGDGGATGASFPVGICMASTWNCDLIELVGRAIAEEAISKDVQVVLGPTINLHRTPLGGRTFEAYSEDPWLSGMLASAFTEGVQGKGVGACLKHYVCNDSEFQRMTISSEVDERTLRELYLRPFEIAIKRSRPWTVMGAYNKINGVYACSHDHLINGVLKGEWQFEGLVMSDWGAALETVPNALGGLDLEMPGPARGWGDALTKAVDDGLVPEATIDDKVRRLLRVLEWSGRYEHPDEKPEQSLDKPEHRQIAYQAASEGMVLLKNDGILPFTAGDLKKVAVIGPNVRDFRIMGGGSSSLTPHYIASPIEALEQRLPDAEVVDLPGCLSHKYIPAPDSELLAPEAGSDTRGLLCKFFGDVIDGELVNERVINRSSLRLAATDGLARKALVASGYYKASSTGEHEFGLLSTSQARLFVNGELLIDNWTDPEPGEAFYSLGTTERRGTALLQEGTDAAIRIEFQAGPYDIFGTVRFGMLPPRPADSIGEAVAAASAADAAILIVGTNDDWETEGTDREMLGLPGDQDELIARVVAANPNTVVVNNSGSPIAMPWLNEAPAVMQCWFAGQEFGNALADILLGEVNPSGKLPISFPKRLEDTPAYTSYPGEFGKVHYGEGLFMGYRWYDSRDLEPLLPFGHGLSYTRFDYTSMVTSSMVAEDQTDLDSPCALGVILRNTGERRGKETIQIYVQPLDSPVARPLKELRAFRKVELDPGEELEVRFELDSEAFCHWDIERSAWKVAPGRYMIHAASSSRDIRLSTEVEVISPEV